MREEQVTRVEKLSIHSHFVDFRTVTVIINHVLGMAQEREALIRRLGFSDNSWMQVQRRPEQAIHTLRNIFSFIKIKTETNDGLESSSENQTKTYLANLP